MPRAGWCRECGEWVWVDADDACANGHGAECVTGIYDAAPKTAERGVGQGEMPAKLDRFNWGAFFVPFFWGIVFGVWPIVYLWLLAFMSPLLLLMLVGSGGTDMMRASMTGVIVISEIINGAVRLWVGMNANRLLWKREERRLEMTSGATSRFSVASFSARQRTWAVVGGVVTVLSVVVVSGAAVLPGDIGEQLRTQISLTPLEAALSVVWLGAEIALGVWLAVKMRQDTPAANPGDALRDAE
jgi:hypothetical protein